jgi:ethanolamine ammonia-lyase small subunit
MKDQSLSLFDQLAQISDARLGLKRSGSSISTQEVLKFDLDHARARDAVHLPFDTDSIAEQLHERKLESLHVQSAATDRSHYLQRPDLGRTLAENSAKDLQKYANENNREYDIAIIIADGLSSRAIHTNAVAFLDEFLPLAKTKQWSLSPVTIASQGRVALADEIGETLRARLSLILIGERPGLSAADSMGIYLTYQPRQGKTDAEKNCISNVRQGGISPKDAALKLENLIHFSFKLCLSGVELKDTEPITIDKTNNIGTNHAGH